MLLRDDSCVEALIIIRLYRYSKQSSGWRGIGGGKKKGEETKHQTVEFPFKEFLSDGWGTKMTGASHSNEICA